MLLMLLWCILIVLAQDTNGDGSSGTDEPSVRATKLKCRNPAGRIGKSFVSRCLKKTCTQRGKRAFWKEAFTRKKCCNYDQKWFKIGENITQIAPDNCTIVHVHCVQNKKAAPKIRMDKTNTCVYDEQEEATLEPHCCSRVLVDGVPYQLSKSTENNAISCPSSCVYGQNKSSQLFCSDTTANKSLCMAIKHPKVLSSGYHGVEFCSASQPCGEGQGDCDGSSQCGIGLTCDDASNNCQDFDPNAPSWADCCTNGITEKDGIISSANFPSSYENNLETTHSISVPSGTLLSIRFIEFDLEYHTSCSYDFLKIVDTSGQELFFGCGQMDGRSFPEDFPPFIETSLGLTITFKTDGSVTKKGFQIKSGSKCCGKKKTGSRIVGGTETDVNEYPWIVGLKTSKIPEEGYYYPTFCGGTLVSSQWVITAAHCVALNRKITGCQPEYPVQTTDCENNKGECKARCNCEPEGNIVSGNCGDNAVCCVPNYKKPQDLLVLIGEHKQSADSDSGFTKEIVVIEVIPHEYYPSTSRNDIALVKLQDPVDLIIYTPACLPMKGLSFDGKLGDIYGWGHTQWKGEKSDVLLEATQTIISDIVCTTMLQEKGVAKTYDMKTGGWICAYGDGNTDTCQGDSGGPMTVEDDKTRRHTLVGVTSHGYGCSLTGYPSLYADVSSYRQWLDDNMKGDTFCPV